MQEYEIGDIVCHLANRNYYISEIKKKKIDYTVPVYDVSILFHIDNNKKISERQAGVMINGRITSSTIYPEKLKEYIEKYPQFFV